MADRKLDLLRRVPIFARCTKAELESLAQHTDEVDMEAGHIVIVEGRPNHSFCVLITGEVAVAVHGKPIDHLGPGQFFGEISMLDGGPATATVTTTTAVEMLVMSHTQFHNAIKAHETIALRVMAVMAERLRRMGLADATSS